MSCQKKLILDISSCPNLKNCEDTPCEKIVKSQNNQKNKRQLPEPWSGDLS